MAAGGGGGEGGGGDGAALGGGERVGHAVAARLAVVALELRKGDAVHLHTRSTQCTRPWCSPLWKHAHWRVVPRWPRNVYVRVGLLLPCQAGLLT